MVRRVLLLALLAGIAGTGEAIAQKPRKKDPQQERARHFYPGALAQPARSPSLVGRVVVPESEPNDDAASADAVALGDQATGVIDPAGDVDYFKVTVTAGTIIDIDVDASQVGSSLDPILEIRDTDGVTSLAFNDDSEGRDSRIALLINTTGDYFVLITDFAGQGGAGFSYTINFNTLAPGPGDPITVVASGFMGAGGLAVDRQGNLYISELFGDRISRVTPGGTATVFATGIIGPRGIAFDGFGDLLVASFDGTVGIVYKVDATGAVSAFLTDVMFPFWVVTGPDGSIYVADLGDFTILTIRRYDEFGTFRESFDVTAVDGAAFMAFSPAGELYFSNLFLDAIYKLVAGQPQLVFTGAPLIEGFAFDVLGNIYAANEFRGGRVTLYAPDGAVVADPFAIPVAPVAAAFGRNPDGTTNPRLFATDFGSGSLVEVNPAGVAAPGWPVTVELLAISPDVLPDAVVGADYSAMLTVADQTLTPTWSIVSGALPPGISLDPATGVLGDFPTQAGTFAFRVRAEAATRFGERDYSITVTKPALVVSDVADELLGVMGVLTAGELRFLDLQGNGNGTFDVGDFRALLVVSGLLGASVAADRVLSEAELYTPKSARGSR